MNIKLKGFELREYKKGDEETLLRNINNKKVSRWTSRIPYPYKLKDAKAWVERCIKLGKKKNKEEFNFAVAIGGEVIGGIGLFNISGHKAEIGYWMGEKYWNKGIMTKAVGAITLYGIKKLKFKRISAYVFKGNLPSIKVLKNNKYEMEGILKKYYLKNAN